jgi:hypothetical protein
MSAATLQAVTDSDDHIAKAMLAAIDASRFTITMEWRGERQCVVTFTHPDGRAVPFLWEPSDQLAHSPHAGLFLQLQRDLWRGIAAVWSRRGFGPALQVPTNGGSDGTNK